MTDKSAKKRLQIAIDGTAGAGKTTIGQMLAALLKCSYLDTGAMYRAVALLALRAGVNLNDFDVLAELAHEMDFATCEASPLESTDGRQYTVLLNGQDVSPDLRSPEVEAIVSQVATIPRVREELKLKQQEIAIKAGMIVMIGRDIGSVVLPDAELKVYLDASPEVRAIRRKLQSGQISTEEARLGLEQRDRLDSQRTAAPLVVAPGAIVINTDDLNQEQVIERIKVALAPLLE